MNTNSPVAGYRVAVGSVAQRLLVGGDRRRSLRSSTLSVHGSESERLRVVDLERGRFGREITDGLGELTRGHPEMDRERIAVDPVFEEDDAIRVFDVVMHRVQEAARFQPGPAHVLEAESQCLLQRFRASSRHCP